MIGGRTLCRRWGSPLLSPVQHPDTLVRMMDRLRTAAEGGACKCWSTLQWIATDHAVAVRFRPCFAPSQIIRMRLSEVHGW